MSELVLFTVLFPSDSVEFSIRQGEVRTSNMDWTGLISSFDRCVIGAKDAGDKLRETERDDNDEDEETAQQQVRT